MRVLAKLRGCLWRPLTDSVVDADFVVALRNDKRFRGQFYSSATITPETHRRFVRGADERGEINWLIERDGTPLGLASIYNIDRVNRKCECGRVIMLEPRLFFLSWVVSATVCFDVLDVNRSYIETLATNTTLANGVERMGMTREGVMRGHVVRDGVPLDVALYAITQPEWRTNAPALYAKWGRPEIELPDGAGTAS